MNPAWTGRSAHRSVYNHVTCYASPVQSKASRQLRRRGAACRPGQKLIQSTASHLLDPFRTGECDRCIRCRLQTDMTVTRAHSADVSIAEARCSGGRQRTRVGCNAKESGVRRRRLYLDREAVRLQENAVRVAEERQWLS
eukprot:6194223-Pleurochrysis_carterae.AAC.2